MSTDREVSQRTKHLIATFKDKVRPTGYKKMGDIKNFNKVPTSLRVAMLHQLLLKMDSDWPYVLTYKTSTIPATSIADVDIMPEVCAECGGLIYNNPSITYNMIVDIASALDLEPAIFMMVDESECTSAYKWLLEKSSPIVGETQPQLHLYEYGSFQNDAEVQQYALDMLNINCDTPEKIKTPDDLPNLDGQDWDLKFYTHGAQTYEDIFEARENQNKRPAPIGFAHVHSGTHNPSGV